jgi:hypothetical protein
MPQLSLYIDKETHMSQTMKKRSKECLGWLSRTGPVMQRLSEKTGV